MNGLSPQQSLYITDLMNLGTFQEYEIVNLTDSAKVYLATERPQLISELLRLVNFV